MAVAGQAQDNPMWWQLMQNQGQNIGGVVQNPNYQPTDWIRQALQGGAGAVQRNEQGDVTGFDYANMGVQDPNMTESDRSAALTASLQSAGLAAQIADSNSAMKELRDLRTSTLDSPEFQQYQGVVNSAVQGGEQLPTSDYAQRANPINAWAQRELDKNANVMARAGVGGSEAANNRATQINMSRGGQLGSAAADSAEKIRQAKISEQNRLAGLAAGLSGTTAAVNSDSANAIARLKSSNQYNSTMTQY